MLQMVRHPQISRLELALLCTLVLLAAWLRLSHLDKVEFLWDQAEISKCGLRMAREGKIAWIGTFSSTGLHFFMGAAWLMAIPYALSTSPVFATGFVAVINLAAVIGCYFLTRRWFGRTAALVAGLLFAVAPWAVIYSRKIWHATFLPPFVLLHVVTGWLSFVRGRRWAIVVHALALAALVQLHFSTYPFAFLTLLWALIFRKRFDWRIALIGGVLAALTFAPYFAVDAQRGWRDVHRLVEIVQRPATVSADAAYDTWIITTGLGLHQLTGPDRYPEFVAATPNVRWLFAAEGGLAAVGGLVALWWVIRKAHAGLDDETAAALMVVTWLAVPVLLMTRYTVPPAPHYFTTTFSSQFILIGWLVALAGRLPRRMARAGQGLLTALVVAIAATQVYEVTSVLQFVMTHDTRLGYGTPVTYEIQAVETATHLGQEMGSTEVILLSAGDEPGMYEMPAVADVLMYGSPHRAVDIKTTLVFPAEPVVYWATHDMTPGEELLATFSPEVVGARIPLREGARSFRFYRWRGGPPSIANLQPLPSLILWANGAQLIGYRVAGDARPGGTLHWTLVWQATGTPTEDTFYHWFNHLLDEQGRLRGQADGPSFLAENWRAGDTVINWFDLQISPEAPPGNYTMRVGMYTYPALDNVPVLGAHGEPDGEWVEIGPLQVGE
jgi:4-amino-4-deoxy-L-arabinose transferase-like glycosyltransferase